MAKSRVDTLSFSTKNVIAKLSKVRPNKANTYLFKLSIELLFAAL
ncbi:MAG: hypothetical protein R3Y04_06975 [Rikenellaceae bacterium]